MKIDVDEVLRLRAPGYYRFIPRFAVRYLEKFICQERLNELLSHNEHLDGADFAEGVIRDLSVDYRVNGDTDIQERRVIFVSNHPLGGLDGLVLASAVKNLYGGDGRMKFVVNDLLTFVAPLRSIFLGINKHGDQSRDAAAMLDEAFRGDDPIVMFPAGLVSRRKFNIEMVRLPAEIFQREGSTFTITLGQPVRWNTLSGGRHAQDEADRIREAVYRLRP